MSNKEEIKDVRLARFARCEKCKYSQYYKNTLLLKCKKLKAAFFDIAICPITKEKIEQKTKQHEAIGVKTDCKYFSNIGNLCSRVENGMMRCDEYLECEFKYIDALKEENKQLQKRFNDYQDRKIEENANLMKRLDIADKKLTVFSRELEQANKENEKLKQYLLNIAMIIEELEQQYDDIKDFTEIKEIKEILREVNQ